MRTKRRVENLEQRLERLESKVSALLEHLDLVIETEGVPIPSRDWKHVVTAGKTFRARQAKQVAEWAKYRNVPLSSYSH